ncbi:ribonucleoside-triphosphate reductase activating protein [Berryella intestinalis]|uniref:Anaerobic ribonucleoside-triphosphate reductase-activating protein n=1 Tax=Berryella intestinalis TaxID=1531429 RepID=A0A0A8B2Z1_9ACTN|nr:anaerobic ribonucleoside-triphosphate reductase activating protein [Berryella intestinalis]AJC11775.1 ribonucleoside-triphosphate reductase activating protein [Berryella intestinalis]
MKYGNVKFFDIANGEGVRTSVFVSGCTHRCKHCFQRETWSFDYGDEFDDAVLDRVVDSLEPPYVEGLSILGGEPMEPRNQKGVLELIEAVRSRYGSAKTIWIYTGDLYEDLTDPASPRHTPFTNSILERIDILVDGPFVEELKNITLRFRGSENQRIIDVPATLEAGSVQLWQDQQVYSTHTMD